ncbi:MAG: THUMP domain-containing protein [Deltaproteobacteria bacterium]
MFDDWNVIITVQEGCFRKARQFLQRYGEVRRTDYFNVLTLKTEDPRQLLERLQELAEEIPESVACLARVVPVGQTFFFTSAQQFEDQAREAIASLAPRLAGSNFFVRLHRRGFKGRISSTEEERLLDDLLLRLLEEKGSPGHINFSEPDAIVVIETVGQRAGIALFTGEELAKYSFLKLK